MAAHRVGPAGYVLATDIAANMLAIAAEAARQAGLFNVATRVLDARALDLAPASFDAAISRNALMLMAERERVLAGICRALKPGRRFAAIVSSTAERNPGVALTRVLRCHTGLPPLPVEDQGLFALGDPGVLKAVYEQAGFRAVAIHALPVVRRFASVDAAAQFRRDANPELTRLLDDLSAAERDRAWAEIGEIPRQFDEGDGVVEPGEYLVGVGTR